LIFYGSSGEERQVLNGFLDFIEKDKLLYRDGKDVRGDRNGE
jgi:hypothetical protein